MDETNLRLDGNAIAGMMREVFVEDMTAARGACSYCGAVAMLGGQPVYDYPDGPGAVLRCRTCDAVLLVLVHAGRMHRIAAQGLSWIEVVEAS